MVLINRRISSQLLMKFILSVCLSDTNRCDKNGDGMLTEDEVKEVGNFLRSNLYFETVETINLFFLLRPAK